MKRILTAVLVCAILAACARSSVDKDKLDSGFDAQIGGLGTCVILADAKTGATVYQYGHFDVCARELPPCETFNIVEGLIGLDAGVITPETVFKWDGSPQPVTAWQRNADLNSALQNGVLWWFQALARQLGTARLTQALSAYGYGSKAPSGPIEGFWRGPQVGGGLMISTQQQVDFLRKFYGGALPVKPAALTAAQALTADETRALPKGGQAAMSGQTGLCASQPDGSRNVGWFVGRLQSPTRDLVFAASVEGAQAPPGFEIERRLKAVLADAGLWPEE